MVDQNYVMDGDRLSEALTLNNMFELDVEWHDNIHEMCCDVRWMMKMKAKSLTYLSKYVNSQQYKANKEFNSRS